MCRYGLFEEKVDDDGWEVRCEWSSLSPLSLEKNLDMLAVGVDLEIVQMTTLATEDAFSSLVVLDVLDRL